MPIRGLFLKEFLFDMIVTILAADYYSINTNTVTLIYDPICDNEEVCDISRHIF